jgi:hypothetical protein
MVLGEELEGDGISRHNTFQKLGLEDVCIAISNNNIVLSSRDNGNQNRGGGDECGKETHGDFLFKKRVDVKMDRARDNKDEN